MEPLAPRHPTAAGGAEPTDPALVGILPERPGHPGYIHIGVDVGQSVDPSAIAIAEVVQRKTGRVERIRRGEDMSDRYVEWAGSEYVAPITETVYLVREFRRLELGKRYAVYAEQIAAKVCAPGILRKARRVFIDATGVGRSVAEDIERAIWRQSEDTGGGGPLSIQRVTFTAGQDYDPRTGSMGKRFLVSKLMSLSQSEPVRMVFAAGQAEAQAMYQELHDYQIRVSRDGADTYGALRTGTHDDLVTAAGLAVLEDPNDYEIGGSISFHAPGYL